MEMCSFSNMALGERSFGYNIIILIVHFIFSIIHTLNFDRPFDTSHFKLLVIITIIILYVAQMHVTDLRLSTEFFKKGISFTTNLHSLIKNMYMHYCTKHRQLVFTSRLNHTLLWPLINTSTQYKLQRLLFCYYFSINNFHTYNL